MPAGDISPQPFGHPGQGFPALGPAGPQPPALTPVSRLAPGTPYVVASGTAGSTTQPATLTVATATAGGDTLVVFAASNTTSNGAPAVTSVSDTKGNRYTFVTGFAAGTATGSGQPCSAWQCAGSVPLTTSDTITVNYAGARGIGQNVTVIGIPGAGPLDQATVAERGSNTTLSATSGTTAWPAELAIAMVNNGNGGGAPSSIGAFAQLQQLHGGTSLYTTIGYLPTQVRQAVTSSVTVGANANLSIILLTFPGVGASDPNQWDPSRQVPPGFFLSPAGNPKVPGPGVAEFAPTPPPPPPPPTTPVPFPSRPGLAWPGQASPGVPGTPGSTPAPTGVPYLIGTQADAAGASTTVVTPTVITGPGDGILVAACCPSATVTSVTDSAGNVYTLATADAAGNEPTWAYLALASLPLATSGNVTVHWSSSAGAKNAVVVGVPGVKFSAAVDQAVHADGTSASPSVTTGTLAQASETAITIVSAANAGGGITWGGGWTGLGAAHTGSTQWTQVSWQNTTTTSPVTGTGTLAASVIWTAVVVTLELATVPVVAQTVTGNATDSDYGFSSVEITTTDGNGLLVLAGWSVAAVTSAPMPRVDVSDSEGNYWVHLGTSAATCTGSRSSIWLCTNAMALGTADRPGWVSVCTSAYVTALAYTVVELSGMPSLVAEDITVTSFSNAASALTLSGTSTEAGTAFAILHAASNAGLASGPAGWTSLGFASAFPRVGDDNVTFPFWLPAIPASTPVTAAWSITGGNVPLSGVLVSVGSSPVAPVPPNASFPLSKVEIGFGYQPGDPSQPPPTWTDITAYAIAKGSDTWAQWSYGRQYELSTPEAGSLTLGIDNHLGYFTPGNSASPFYPNVTLETPVRYSAFWSGRWYHVAYGYVERWPQEWPDLPQWGLSKMVATDAISIMAATDMPSALQGELLLDAPEAFIPCSEQYLTFFNGLNSSGSLTSAAPADAQGLPAANLSRTNQVSGFYTNGSGASLDTGQALNLVGDSGTVVGTSNATSTQTRGPGMVYVDPSMPGPSSTTGCSLEFWAIKNDNSQVTLLSAYGPPSPYNLGNFAVEVIGSGPHFIIVLGDSGIFASAPFTLSADAQHIVVTITPTTDPSFPAEMSLYVNASLLTVAPMLARDTTTWGAAILGCARYQQGNAPLVANYIAGDLAVYDHPLPASRITAHYQTGISGQQGATLCQRTAQVLTWGYLGLPRGGPVTFGTSAGDVFQGPAYGIANAPATDGINTALAGDGGMVAAMPSGALTVLPRWWLYDIPPAVTFGDTVTPATEVPYEPGQAFDFDNTYLYNVSSSQQSLGATQGITVSEKDFPSQKSYFTRSALSQTTNTTSFYDAYDQASWSLNRYAQPSIRVRSLTVNAAKTPTSFTAALKTRVSTVATTVRRPVGGATISEVVQVQRVSGAAGPGNWNIELQLSPYVPDDAVLILDEPGFDVLGGNADPR